MPTDFRDLVRQAFEMARRTGRQDWFIMALPVLKNRILQLTHREFREADYGGASFRALLHQVSDIISLDDTRSPALVTLIGHEQEPAPDATPAATPDLRVGSKIRPDLWDAMLDYSSGATYVWDAAQGLARLAQDPDEAPILPTAKPEDLATWRQEFLERLGDALSSADRERVVLWKDEARPTASLPPHLRGRWVAVLKRKIADRILAWFTEHGLQAPPDLVLSPPVETAKSETGSGRPVGATVAELRAFLTDCINVMTEEELCELRLPPAVVLRARRLG